MSLIQTMVMDTEYMYLRSLLVNVITEQISSELIPIKLKIQSIAWVSYQQGYWMYKKCGQTNQIKLKIVDNPNRNVWDPSYSVFLFV